MADYITPVAAGGNERVVAQDEVQTPLVSVVMSAYNHGAYIDEAIEGVLRQTVAQRIELIVADDCSTDDTLARARAWELRHPAVRVLPTPVNVGMHRNFMRALAACRGEVIAFCEGDDVWINDRKLEVQLEELTRHPEASLVFHAAVYAESADCDERELVSIDDRPRVLSSREGVLLHANFVPTASMVLRRRTAERVLQLPESVYLNMCSDMLVQITAALEGELRFLPRAMALYRKAPGGWSSTQAASADKRYQSMLAEYRALDALVAVSEGEHAQALAALRSRTALTLLADQAIPVAKRRQAFDEFTGLGLTERLRWYLIYQPRLALRLALRTRRIRWYLIERAAGLMARGR